MKNIKMNKFLLFIAATALFSCNNTTENNFVTISGKFDNVTSKAIVIQNKDYQKEITIKEDGTFSDTLHLKAAEEYIGNFYTVSTEKGRIFSYLKNGFDINLNINEDDFENSVKVSGEGSKNIEYILERIKESGSLEKLQELFSLDKAAYTIEIEKIKNTFDAIVHKHKGIEKELYDGELESNIKLYDGLLETYDQQNRVIASTAKGAPSPKFVNYENFKGGTTSLDDLKGKYVYIDVWATWCGPCRQQIPFLKEVEKKYHGKNIEFVSISTDKPNKHDAWKEMVTENNMGGIQLIAGSDQSFMMDYQISGIPRFILIDPQGNIVESNAPRPSDPNLEKLFKTLKL
jgi:thiol-disulfide isomerase/thioredoxin